MEAPALAVALDRIFERRVAPLRRLSDNADLVARACHSMAARFQAGGTLIVFGDGAASTDAQHVSVEFVHPVIVGKRALPAISLTTDVATLTGVANERGFTEVFAHQLRCLARPPDIALGLSATGDCPNVLRGLRVADELGLLTVALVGGTGGAIARESAAEHTIVACSPDPRVIKEVHVTTYHILWELVHVYFDQPGLLPLEVTTR